MNTLHKNITADKMSAKKLSSEEVPKKFVEWLLDMGYPESKIPSIDKITQKCRGQYYMVWRSLMEHVRPKDEIRQKRLTVFYEDMIMCKENNVFNEKYSSVVVPDQLLLWRESRDIQKQIDCAEARVTEARQNLSQLMDKVSSRICQNDLLRKKIEEKQRRVGLLRQVCEDLTVKKTHLEETKEIASSLCSDGNDDELQEKIERCIGLLRRQGAPPASRSLSASNPIASSSVISIHGDDIEEQMAALARAKAHTLWARLCERRSALTAELARATTQASRHGSSTQSVLARTADLHCTSALEALKTRSLVKRTGQRIAAYVADFNNETMSGEACELLVVRCERASAEARVRSLRTSLAELAVRSGMFANVPECTAPVSADQIADVDKTIRNAKDKLNRLVLSLAITEKKINGTKEVLNAVFNSFHRETPINNYKGMQLDLPQESLATIQKFYSEKREQRTKMEISLDLGTSDASYNDSIESPNPSFKDELRIYLKKFNLEKNRKLVVDSGEKIWIFETLQTSLERLQSKWLDNDLSPMLCPSVSLVNNIKTIIAIKQSQDSIQSDLKKLECDWKRRIDIKSKKEQEEVAIDKMKKIIAENQLSLQKTAKTLELCQNNLHLWRDDVFKTLISKNRTVDGNTYKDYEIIYMETTKY